MPPTWSDQKCPPPGAAGRDFPIGAPAIGATHPIPRGVGRNAIGATHPVIAASPGEIGELLRFGRAGRLGCLVPRWAPPEIGATHLAGRLGIPRLGATHLAGRPGKASTMFPVVRVSPVQRNPIMWLAPTCGSTQSHHVAGTFLWAGVVNWAVGWVSPVGTVGWVSPVRTGVARPDIVWLTRHWKASGCNQAGRRTADERS